MIQNSEGQKLPLSQSPFLPTLEGPQSNTLPPKVDPLPSIPLVPTQDTVPLQSTPLLHTTTDLSSDSYAGEGQGYVSIYHSIDEVNGGDKGGISNGAAAAWTEPVNLAGGWRAESPVYVPPDPIGQ